MPTKEAYIHWHYYPMKSPPGGSDYPVISNVRVTSSGHITWTTDIPSTSQVFYGVVPYLGFQTDRDSTLVTSHSVQLHDLVIGTLYYFRVQSFFRDALSISDLYAFVAALAPSILLEDGVNFLLSEDGTPINLET